MFKLEDNSVFFWRPFGGQIDVHLAGKSTSIWRANRRPFGEKIDVHLVDISLFLRRPFGEHISFFIASVWQAIFGLIDRPFDGQFSLFLASVWRAYLSFYGVRLADKIDLNPICKCTHVLFSVRFLYAKSTQNRRPNVPCLTCNFFGRTYVLRTFHVQIVYRDTSIESSHCNADFFYGL
jgi:hypothetical protein